MDPRVATGLIVFLLAIAAARGLMNRALAQMSPDEKARLLDGFARRRVMNAIVLAALVGAYALLGRVAPDLLNLSDIGYISLLGGLILLFALASYRRLVVLQLPPHLGRAFALAKGLQLVGFVALAMLLLKR